MWCDCYKIADLDIDKDTSKATNISIKMITTPIIECGKMGFQPKDIYFEKAKVEIHFEPDIPDWIIELLEDLLGEDFESLAEEYINEGEESLLVEFNERMKDCLSNEGCYSDVWYTINSELQPTFLKILKLADTSGQLGSVQSLSQLKFIRAEYLEDMAIYVIDASSLPKQ